MLDGTSTGADDPVVCGAWLLAYSVTVTLVLQKRYFVRDLRLQIVWYGLSATFREWQLRCRLVALGYNFGRNLGPMLIPSQRPPRPR